MVTNSRRSLVQRSSLYCCLLLGLLLFGAVGLTLPDVNRSASAQTCTADTWTTKASLPTPRGGASSAVVNDQLYIISGFTNAGETRLVQAYNPATNTWTTKAPIPTARSYSGAAAIGNKIYVAGGCGANQDCRVSTLSTLEIYDTVTDTWTTGAPMQTIRHGFAMGAINGRLYVAGGRQFCPPCNDAHTTEEYDPATNTWTTKATMPTVRNNMNGVVLNGELYVVGGIPGLSGVSGAVEAYNPVTNTWTTKASMLTPRTASGLAVVGNKLYAISGQTANPPFVTHVVEEYDACDKLVDDRERRFPRHATMHDRA